LTGPVLSRFCDCGRKLLLASQIKSKKITTSKMLNKFFNILKTRKLKAGGVAG
jgi:hypothetical protein